MGEWRWRNYQQEVIEQVLEGEGVGLIALPLGAGKSAVAVEIVRRRLNNRLGNIVVVAPLNTHSGWRRHFNILMPGIPVAVIDGTKDGKANAEMALAGEPGVWLIGWERNRTYDWSRTEVDAVIIDESARMGNRKAKQTKAVWTLKHVPTKLCLSATPAGNRIENIWSTLHFLWPQKWKHFWPFVKAFLDQRPDPFAGMVITGEKRPGIVAKSIPVYAKRTEEEVHGEIPEPVIHHVEVDLTPAQRKVYRQFEDDALAWLDGNPVAAALPVTKMIRLLQVCLAVPTVQTVETREGPVEQVTFAPDAKSSKIDALLDILSDLPDGEKVLVWTHSKRIVPVVMDRLQRAGYDTTGVSGGQSADARMRALRSFKEGEAQVLIATIPALGEGVDGLQHVCATEVWLSHSDNLTLNRQAEGRLRRPGQERIINRFIIEASDTLETRQLGRLSFNKDKLVTAGMM